MCLIAKRRYILMFKCVLDHRQKSSSTSHVSVSQSVHTLLLCTQKYILFQHKKSTYYSGIVQEAGRDTGCAYHKAYF